MRKLLFLLGFPALAISACGGNSVTDLFTGATSGGGGASASSSMHASSGPASATSGMMTSSSSGMQTSSTGMMTSSTGMEAASSSADVASSAAASVASSAASTGSGMSCFTCADIVTNMSDPMKICPGNSADAYNKLTSCVCGVGGACYFNCVGNVCIGFMPSMGCSNCIQNPQQGCGGEFATCLQN